MVRPDLPYTAQPSMTLGADGRWRDEDGYLLHRIDGPTIVSPIGEEWFYNGWRHRAGAPAIVSSLGIRVWCWKDLVHRSDGPAYEDPVSGDQWWYRDTRYLWFLTGALFRNGGTRRILASYETADVQRERALTLLPALAPELRAQAVAEALASPDTELRRWGNVALGRLGPRAQDACIPPDGVRLRRR